MADEDPTPNPLFPIVSFDPAALAQVFPGNQRIIDALSRTQSVDQALRDKLAGTDPDYVKTLDQFDGYSHQQIYDGVHGRDGQGGMSVTTIDTLRGVWDEIDTELTRIATTHQTTANALLGFGEWAGASGDSARAGIAALNTSILRMAQVCEAMTSRLDIVGPAVEAIRMAVQPPTAQIGAAVADENYIQVIPGLNSPVVATVDRQAQRQAELDTQAAMNRIYTPTIPPTGSGVPSYSVVPGTEQGGGGPGGSGGGSPSAGAPSAGSPVSPTEQTPTQPETTPETPTTEDPTTPTPNTPSDDDATSPTSPTATSPTSTDDTSPASTAPAATTPTSPTPSGLGAPLGGAGSPLGSGGSPGGSGLPNSAPAPIQSPTAGGQLAASGGANAARATGMPGMGMMPGAGAGAGRKPGDADDEHYAPDYLRGLQPELIDDTHALAGVIGADDYPEPAEATPRPAPVTSLLDQPPTPEPSTAPTESAPTTGIEPTAPTLPPDIAALLAEHEDRPPPTPANGSEHTAR
ncbi:hypothetical protein [Nocardia lasii]|uniref:WXG100 family type VII secretion target n=1 Tax=Nocardia lasii TaxID=1616107 RepID=A0ABW1K039_9NOCA